MARRGRVALERTSRLFVVATLLVACEAEPFEKLEAPPRAPTLAPPARPPPPPPPPPPPKSVELPARVPQRVADFLGAHTNDAGPWRVTFYSLGEAKGPFLGGEVLHHQRVKDAIAAEVIAWLGDDKTYVTENGTRGCGWVTPELGIEVARGSASLRMRWNCGYLFFDDGHKVRETVGSDGTIRFIDIEKHSGFER